MVFPASLFMYEVMLSYFYFQRNWSREKANTHIVVFTHRKNNQFQKKSIMYTGVYVY